MPRLKKDKESDYLEKYLKEELDKHNIFNYHGISEGKKGFPDRVIIADQVYLVELKLGKENNSYYEQTPTQKKWEKQFSQAGINCYLIKSREDIDKLVEEIYQRSKNKEIKNFFEVNKNIV